MARKMINQFKLGVFVLAGLSFLVLLLYVIGKNQSLFGNTFLLKARFANVQGLMPGNNIRFAGIDAGTVKSIKVLNDTTVEVRMMIKENMKEFIRKDAKVSINTDGLMGNRIINIEPGSQSASLVAEGDVLFSQPGTDPEEMLKVLSNTNNDIAVIASELKTTIKRINQSRALWKLLEDETIPENIHSSLQTIRSASAYLSSSMVHLNQVTREINEGKGSLGQLLKDTGFISETKMMIGKIKLVGEKADSLSEKISCLVENIQLALEQGNGSLNALMTNEKMKNDLVSSMENIESGTRAFRENMEALKHNILLRGYFKKMERKKKESSP